MAYVVVAYWRAKPGKEDVIAEVIAKMTPLSRQEPGCIFYQGQRATDDPQLFLMYEQYRGQEGYEAHMATSHFEQYVRSQAIPNLESRERQFFEALDV